MNCRSSATSASMSAPLGTNSYGLASSAKNALTLSSRLPSPVDRALELLRLLVPVGHLLDLAHAEARKGVVTDQGLDLPARDVLHDVVRRRIRAGRTADARAPDLLEFVFPLSTKSSKYFSRLLSNWETK